MVGVARTLLKRQRIRDEGNRLAETGDWNRGATWNLLDAKQGLARAIREAIDLTSAAGAPISVSELARNALSSTELDVSDPALYQGALDVCRRAIRESSVDWLPGVGLPRLLTVQLSDGDFIRVPVETASVRNLRNMYEHRLQQLREHEEAVQRLAKIVQITADCDDDEMLRDALQDVQHVALGVEEEI
jgi:hypothetical protein